MNSNTLPLVMAAIAAMYLSVISDLIYDFLRDAGILPRRPTIKFIVIFVVVTVPFIFLSILPNLPKDYLTSLVNIAQTPVQLWALLAVGAGALLLGYLTARVRIAFLTKDVSEVNAKLSGTEAKLQECERSMDEYRRTGRYPLQETVIRPGR
jgi:hypothetical protein